ncbi:ferredoxin [Nonomuraea sp. NPDC048916]|uniref:ferredoxin n=1 Tax=Nonomuraea sp. NPDC048916 TaxID=3154232 RepID=UPI0033E6C8B3
MKLVVDLNRFRGFAQCAFLAPDVFTRRGFTMRGEAPLMYLLSVGEEQRVHVLRAAAACPLRALSVDRAGEPEGAGVRAR